MRVVDEGQRAGANVENDFDARSDHRRPLAAGRLPRRHRDQVNWVSSGGLPLTVSTMMRAKRSGSRPAKNDRMPSRSATAEGPRAMTVSIAWASAAGLLVLTARPSR